MQGAGNAIIIAMPSIIYPLLVVFYVIVYVRSCSVSVGESAGIQSMDACRYMCVPTLSCALRSRLRLLVDSGFFIAVIRNSLHCEDTRLTDFPVMSV